MSGTTWAQGAVGTGSEVREEGLVGQQTVEGGEGGSCLLHWDHQSGHRSGSPAATRRKSRQVPSTVCGTAGTWASCVSVRLCSRVSAHHKYRGMEVCGLAGPGSGSQEPGWYFGQQLARRIPGGSIGTPTRYLA